MKKLYVLWGAIFMMTGVATGAFGAHALKDLVNTSQLEIWKTAVLYQFIHGLGMLALSAIIDELKKFRKAIFYCLLIGIVLFSGSLYILTLTENSTIRSIAGPLTPIGGLSFIAGWFLLIMSFINKNNTSK